MTPLLRLAGIGKTFPGVRALAQVDFDLAPGEVHVLFGENGAGKSTLIGIVAGALSPDEGSVELAGEPVALRSVQHARQLGITAMFQEFSLAPDLSVADNILLGDEPTIGPCLDRRTARRRVAEVLQRLDFSIEPRRPVRELSRAEQQMVEMAKALLRQPRILILDEPTASLTDRDAKRLFALIERLKAQGVGIIYITHRIAEIHQVGDRITVLRDGRRIGTIPVSGASREGLVEMMTGRRIDELFPAIEHRPGEALLSVERLSTRSGSVQDVSLEVRAGEIVGLAGLIGCGKSEIGRACFGLEEIAEGGIRYLGQPLSAPSPGPLLRRGLCYIPSDRRREGLLLTRPLRENLTITALDLDEITRAGVLRRGSERATAGRLANLLQIRPPRLEAHVAQYSGGNQQKAVLARALLREMRVCILDEPTVGVDVGARRQIYDLLKALAERGAGLLLISSELTEILNLCNRVYVIRDGRVSATYQGAGITEQQVLTSFFHAA